MEPNISCLLQAGGSLPISAIWDAPLPVKGLKYKLACLDLVLTQGQICGLATADTAWSLV